jgi:hypothetical protein
MDENIISGNEVSLKDFFEKIPPNNHCKITNNIYEDIKKSKFLYIPEITLFCNNEKCLGERLFVKKNYSTYYLENEKLDFLIFSCKNCGIEKKIYSLFIFFDSTNNLVIFNKIGELPLFGQRTSSKLIELVGPDKEYFLLGRRCENQGLGIGAFTYYRRVVENQKNRIFDKIIEVAKKVSIKNEIISDLESAKLETQFKTGVDKIKHALPESLLIDGHNPLVLLHKALSEGVHEKSDSECLELASSIRIILAELTKKASNVLKEDAEVKSALSNLFNRK